MFCHLLVYSGLVTKLCIPDIKQKCNGWVEKVFQGEITRTKPGSIAHLLYGESPSEQSIHIKMGRLGEYLSKELIKSNTQLTLLTCGIQQVHDKKKDVDLIFKDDVHKIVYYRELKGNIELDTEKLSATIQKCREIESSLQGIHVGYTIDCGILNWSVYDRKVLTAGLSNIRTFEKAGLKIDHMRDFLDIVQVNWPETDFYAYFREIGKKIKNM